MKAVKRKLASLYFNHKYNALCADQKKFTKLQRRNFEKLSSHLVGTRISNHTGLESLKDYNEFSEHFGVREYDDFKPYVDAHILGAKSVLFNSKIKYYGLTSGTSGKDSKKIPYNNEMIKLFQSAQKYLASVISHEVKGLDILSSERLTYGSNPIAYVQDNVKYGYISGILNSKTPKSLKRVTYPSQETLEVENWEHKLELLLKESIDRDIKLASGIPSYLISIFEYILEETGKQTINEIWPNLETIVYGATAIDQYRNRLNELVGRELNYFGIYASTEAPIGISVNNAKTEKQVYAFHPELVLTFNKVDNFDQCGIQDLEVGENYYVNTSTPNGLVNYTMKDIVRIKSTSPLLTFEVLGRKGSGINLAAEKTSDDQVLDSILNLNKKLSINVDHYFLSPTNVNGKMAYSWTLFSDALTSLNEKEVEELIDEILCQQNLDYKDCRDDGILERPVVRIVSSKYLKDYFHQYKDKGQFKMKTVFGCRDSFSGFIQQSLPELNSVLGAM